MMCFFVIIACGFFLHPSLGNHRHSDADVKLAFILGYSREWEIGYKMAAGLILGVETVRERQLIPANWTIDWDWRDTYCRARRGLAMTVDLWSHFNTRPSAIIGGGCSIVCEPVALLAAAWNVPFISYGCTSHSLSNKFNYPTFSRSVGTWLSLAPLYARVVGHFGWERVAVVTTTRIVLQLTANSIKLELENIGVTVFYFTFQEVYDGDKIDEERVLKQNEIIRRIKEVSRGRDSHGFSMLNVQRIELVFEWRLTPCRHLRPSSRRGMFKEIMGSYLGPDLTQVLNHRKAFVLRCVGIWSDLYDENIIL